MPASSPAKFTGKVVQWNQETGSGLVQLADELLQIHMSDLPEGARPPVPGEVIQFGIGPGPDGQRSVRGADLPPRPPSPWFYFGVWSGFGALLTLPVLALFRLGSPAWMPATVMVVMSLISYFTHLRDRMRYRERGQGFSVRILHTTEVFGGWPGAYLARWLIRPARSGFLFSITQWTIILLYQYVALDSLLNWELTLELGMFLHETSRKFQ